MFDRILPRSLDNTYRAHRAALWLLGLVAGVKMVQSLSVIFNGYGTAVAADGIHNVVGGRAEPLARLVMRDKTRRGIGRTGERR